MGNNKGSVIAVAGITALFWGFSFMGLDIMLETFAPLQILALRWLLAAVIFLVLALTGVIDAGLKGRKKKWLLITALVQPCAYSIFETYGVLYTNASISSIFIATIPCFTLILGILLFHRRPSGGGILGILLAFTGVVVCTVFAPGFAAGGRLYGYLILIGAVACGGVYVQCSAEASKDYSPLAVTAWMAFLGGIWFCLLNFAMGYGAETFTLVFTDRKLIAGVLFLGVGCSSVGYVGYNVAIQKMKDPAAAGNVVASLVTTIGVLAGVFLRGDAAGWYTAVGVVLTLTGVVISSREG